MNGTVRMILKSNLSVRSTQPSFTSGQNLTTPRYCCQIFICLPFNKLHITERVSAKWDMFGMRSGTAKHIPRYCWWVGYGWIVAPKSHLRLIIKSDQDQTVSCWMPYFSEICTKIIISGHLYWILMAPLILYDYYHYA